MANQRNFERDNDGQSWLVATADEAGLPSFSDPERLGRAVREQTALYNSRGSKPEELAGAARTRESLAARLAFWLPRDLPKFELSAREVLDAGRLIRKTPTAPWRVLDLGCGLGAGHRGFARALALRGESGAIVVDAVDQDPRILGLLRTLTAQRPREGAIELELSIHQDDLAGMGRTAASATSWVERWHRRHPGRYDLVILGQVLCELAPDLEVASRLELQSTLLDAVLRQLVEPDGILLVVEPALRGDARNLQQLRAKALDAGATVVAPCLHRGACPLLTRETDWCHEDRAVDLPEWLVPIARLAGLRWEGLTFSFLAISPSGPALVDALRLSAGPSAVTRAVSAPRVTKGKTELTVCGDHLGSVGLLDREVRPGNRALISARRGDVLALPEALDAKHRVDSGATVTVLRKA